MVKPKRELQWRPTVEFRLALGRAGEITVEEFRALGLGV